MGRVSCKSVVDASVKNASRLPIQCLKEKQISKESTGVDCKVHTSFTSACSGRENCTVHMQRIRLNSPKDNCHNELVDYTMAFFECISGKLERVKIRGINQKNRSLNTFVKENFEYKKQTKRR